MQPAYMQLFHGSQKVLKHCFSYGYMQLSRICNFFLVPEQLHITGFYCITTDRVIPGLGLTSNLIPSLIHCFGGISEHSIEKKIKKPIKITTRSDSINRKRKRKRNIFLFSKNY